MLRTGENEVSINRDRAVGNLSRALTFQTIAHRNQADTNTGEFLRFHHFLQQTYPNIKRSLGREIVNHLNLLYTWKGSDPSLKPILLMAHIDVVPAEESTLSRWTHPPFSGYNDGVHIWGRGALDMKSSLVAIMEAVETLLESGFTPRRTVYIALGCDEEQGGSRGSKIISELLTERGVRLAMVLDEGGSVISGMISFLNAPVALIGIAEKGYLTLELSVESAGGHSSMPPRETPAGILCAAVARLEASPFPLHLDGIPGDMLDYLAPEASFPVRFVLSNTWLFGPLIARIMSTDPASAAALRTTTAPTMLQGSERENILPSMTKAFVNFRILPGESIKSVMVRTGSIINDERVKISVSGNPWEPSPITSTQSHEFEVIRKTITRVFPGTNSAPYLVLGATDSRYYSGISDAVFRFCPYVITREDLKSIHGIDEKISIENMAKSVEFYTRIIKNID